MDISAQEVCVQPSISTVPLETGSWLRLISILFYSSLLRAQDGQVKNTQPELSDQSSSRANISRGRDAMGCSNWRPRERDSKGSVPDDYRPRSIARQRGDSMYSSCLQVNKKYTGEQTYLVYVIVIDQAIYRSARESDDRRNACKRWCCSKQLVEKRDICT